MSPLLTAYLGFSHISGPIWRAIHRRRLKRGKEVRARLPEKYGVYQHPRPKGEVLWFHALSVGESLALLPLIERALAVRPQSTAVLTTSTASSIAALGKAALPDRCIHVLLPIDTKRAVTRFLDYWAPSLAAFAELDFWPRLMVDTKARGVPMMLINSRLPEQNFERRKRLGGMARDIVGLFDRLLVQDDQTRERFQELGAAPDRIRVLGALKAAARPLPADLVALEKLRAGIGTRPVWCAAATQGDEHAAMIAAHVAFSRMADTPLLILAPRFVDDADAAEALAFESFSKVARRSRGEWPSQETEVYIADTFGEMGLWYRVAPISFVGHSLLGGLEGKNPFEAAALGSAILYGPHVSYFAESYEALAQASAARLVTSPDELASTLTELQSEPARRNLTEAAQRVIADHREVLDHTWDELAAALKPPG